MSGKLRTLALVLLAVLLILTGCSLPAVREDIAELPLADAEGVLPKVKGRTYYEADCYYTKGKRTAERIVYSSDGHVWYTEDHYVTFTELFPSGQEE